MLIILPSTEISARIKLIRNIFSVCTSCNDPNPTAGAPILINEDTTTFDTIFFIKPSATLLKLNLIFIISKFYSSYLIYIFLNKSSYVLYSFIGLSQNCLINS